MATTYKVLGQTSATAAAATENLNLVKDPSFDNSTLTGQGTAHPGANTYVSLSSIGLPLWHAGTESSTANYKSVADGAASGYSALYGSKSLGWYFNNADTNYSFYLQYGAGSGLTGLTATSRASSPSTSIPVSGSTTYYFGTSMRMNNINVFTSQYMYINWFDSSNTYITDTTLALTESTSWTRTTGTATSPANAAYATITLYFYTNANPTACGLYFDGVHFSPISSTNTTFPNPYTGSNLTLTSPFTSRLSTGWSGTANNSTTVNSFAGADVDLYTVPGSTQTVVSTISVSNLSTSATTYRVAVVPSGETLAKKHWIVFDAPISGNSTDTLTLGVTLNAGDKIKVSSDIADVSFSAFGSEIA